MYLLIFQIAYTFVSFYKIVVTLIIFISLLFIYLFSFKFLIFEFSVDQALFRFSVLIHLLKSLILHSIGLHFTFVILRFTFQKVRFFSYTIVVLIWWLVPRAFDVFTNGNQAFLIALLVEFMPHLYLWLVNQRTHFAYDSYKFLERQHISGWTLFLEHFVFDVSIFRFKWSRSSFSYRTFSLINMFVFIISFLLWFIFFVLLNILVFNESHEIIVMHSFNTT
jgi:hypothetical protein